MPPVPRGTGDVAACQKSPKDTLSLRTSVATLVWQSVSFVPPLAPTLGELVAKPTERVSIALSAPTGHLSHRERQVALIRHGCAVPPSPPRGKLGERIATPVCGLVRNDMVFRKYQRIK